MWVGVGKMTTQTRINKLEKATNVNQPYRETPPLMECPPEMVAEYKAKHLPLPILCGLSKSNTNDDNNPS